MDDGLLPIVEVEPLNAVDAVIYQTVFATTCAIGGNMLSGTVDIAYVPGTHLLEVEGFEDWLYGWCDTNNFTVESLTRFLHDCLSNTLLPRRIEVTVCGSSDSHGKLTASVFSECTT